MAGTRPLPGGPKEALAQFLEDVDALYYPWMDSASWWNKWLWLGVHTAAICCGVAATVLAALMMNEAFRESRAARVWLIVLPALATAFSTLLVQFRLHGRLALREEGRRVLQRMWYEGRRRYAAARSDEECGAILKELEAELARLAETQAESALGLMKGEAPKPIGGSRAGPGSAGNA